jgi:hypothetical protein
MGGTKDRAESRPLGAFAVNAPNPVQPQTLSSTGMSAFPARRFSR